MSDRDSRFVYGIYLERRETEEGTSKKSSLGCRDLWTVVLLRNLTNVTFLTGGTQSYENCNLVGHVGGTPGEIRGQGLRELFLRTILLRNANRRFN